MKKVVTTGLIALGLVIMSSQVTLAGGIGDVWKLSDGNNTTNIYPTIVNPDTLTVEGTDGVTTTVSDKKLTIGLDTTKVLSPDKVIGGKNITVTNDNGEVTVALNDSLTDLTNITTGKLTVNESLNVTGEASFSDNVTVKKDLVVDGTSKLKNTYIRGNLDVSGKSTLSDTSIDGKLDVTGDANLHGNATIDKNLNVKGDTNLEGRLNVAGNTALGGSLEVTGSTHLRNNLRVDGVASFGNDVSMDRNLTVRSHTSLNSVSVDHKALFRSGADMGGHRVVNVAAGEVSSTSHDAVIGSQLWDVSERANKIGARAAAMSNLNPMGYDKNAPTSFAFALGNYSGENAVALGLHHYFSQDALLSLSGTLGSGNNMVSAGVSFRLGRSSKETLTATAGSVATQTDPFILERLDRLEAENAEMRKQNANMQIQLLKLSQ